MKELSTNLKRKLSEHERIMIVEFTPDNPNLLPLVSKVKQHVDAVRLTALKNAGDSTNPEKTAEKICLESSIRLTRASEVDVIASMVCRDHPRNDVETLRLAKEAGVVNHIVLHGDPNDPPFPNYYQFESAVELVRWIRQQESLIPRQGDAFNLAVGSDPTSNDIRRQVLGLRDKVNAGANFTITQPIFDPAQGLRFLGALKAAGLRVPVIVGLLALKSQKSAQFLESRIGVTIPTSAKERMRNKGVEEGLAIAADVHSALADKVEGFYIYPWADGNLDVTVSLLEKIRTP